jgi:hypothetical protein
VLSKSQKKERNSFQKMPSNCLGQHFSNPHAYRVVAEHCRNPYVFNIPVSIFASQPCWFKLLFQE